MTGSNRGSVAILHVRLDRPGFEIQELGTRQLVWKKPLGSLPLPRSHVQD